MIRCVIYDLDGVLVDACEWHYVSLNRALKSVVNYEIDRPSHEATFNGLPTREKLRILADMGIVAEKDFEKITNLKQSYTLDCIQEMCVTDATKIEMLTYARSQNLKVGCVTNAIRTTSELALQRTGQLGLLDLLLTNQDVPEPKPNPAGYIMAMEMLGASPSETLIVEDSPKGIMAARGSGANVQTVTNATEVTLENLRLWLFNYNEV